MFLSLTEWPLLLTATSKYVITRGWSGDPKLQFKGRMLRLRIKDDKVIKTTVVAEGMEHPNGVRVRGNHIYVTQSMLSKVKDPSGLLVSCVYMFSLDDENIKSYKYT